MDEALRMHPRSSHPIACSRKNLPSGKLAGPDVHRKKGMACEASRQWDRAVDHYYRSLCSIPAAFGAQEWYQQYLMGHDISATFSKEEIGALYASIGRCKFAMGRFGDAVANLEASRCWSPIDQSTQRLLDNLKKSILVDNPLFHAPGDEAPANREPIAKRVTVLMVTNFTRKIVKYRDLAPPSTRLISATYGSLIDVFGENLASCPKIVCYDADPGLGRQSESYLAALDHFCSSHGFSFHVFEKKGLLGILGAIVPTIETPYIFFVEHDWFFKPQVISLSNVLRVLDRHDDIHLIRFNKRRNLIAGLDIILEKETRIPEIPLLRTSAHSNNPCLIRTQTLNDTWLPYCLQDSFFASQEIGGTPLGVEEALFKSHITSIRRDGFSKAHSQMGTYIYGNVGDPERIIHLGE